MNRVKKRIIQRDPKYSLDDKGKQLLKEYDNTDNEEFKHQIVIISIMCMTMIIMLLIILSDNTISNITKLFNSDLILKERIKHALLLVKYGTVIFTCVMYLYIMLSIKVYKFNRKAWIKYFLYFHRKG